MIINADLHIHSRFSGATSDKMNIKTISKGIVPRIDPLGSKTNASPPPTAPKPINNCRAPNPVTKPLFFLELVHSSIRGSSLRKPSLKKSHECSEFC